MIIGTQQQLNKNCAGCDCQHVQFTKDIARTIGLSVVENKGGVHPPSSSDILHQATRLKKLNELVLALSQLHQINDAYKVVAQYTRSIVGAARVSVAMMRECGTQLDLIGVDGLEGALMTGKQLPVINTACGEIFNTRRPVRVMDTSQNEWIDVKQLYNMGVVATIGVPLISSGKVIGSLNTGVKDPSIYFPEVEQFLFQIASVLASVIERDRLYREACEAKRLAIEEKQKALGASNAKSTFLSQMTHELRTPMNGVLGMASLLSQTELCPKQRELVQMLQTSGDNLLTTINDILDYSKIEANKLVLEEVPFCADQCIQDTLSLVQVNAQEKGVELQTDFAADCPKGLIQDVTRVRQVLTNLVGNAIKFTHSGTIKVSAKPYCGNDSEKTTPADRTTIHFSVQDSGIGIPVERQSTLFDSFSQVDSSTTRLYGGSGLGLAISKRLAELMGGRVWVESLEGKGSTFHFTIQARVTNIRCGSTAQKVETFDTALGERNPLRILLAEDVKVNQKVAMFFLKKLGYHDVTIVENGQEAVQACESSDGGFDLIFMDLHMPILDGYEATERIRFFDKSVRIVAMTAAVMVQDQGKAFDCGMDDFVPKPVRIKELTKALEKTTPRAGVNNESQIRAEDTQTSLRVPLDMR